MTALGAAPVAYRKMFNVGGWKSDWYWPDNFLFNQLVRLAE